MCIRDSFLSFHLVGQNLYQSLGPQGAKQVQNLTVELLSIIDDVVIIKRTSTFLHGPKGKVQKKHKKKLTNVSLYVCMYVCKAKTNIC